MSTTGFLLSAIGAAVGLGNIWGFPTKLINYGGAVFFIPYIIAVILLGLPLLILEINLGHKWRRAPFSFFKSYIGMPGRMLGWGQAIIQYLIVTYYTVIIAWVVLSAFASLTDLPGLATSEYFATNITGPNGTAADVKSVFANPFGSIWTTVFFVFVGITLFAVFVVGLGVVKGIEKINKIMIPSLFIFIIGLLIFALTLPGGARGIQKLFYPDFTKLADGKAWSAAFGQALFSLSLAGATIIVFSNSAPEAGDNSNRAITIMTGDTLIALIASVIIACVLGYGLSGDDKALFASFAETGTGDSIKQYVASGEKIFKETDVTSRGIVFIEGLQKTGGGVVTAASLAGDAVVEIGSGAVKFGGSAIVFQAFPQLFYLIGGSLPHFNFANILGFFFYTALFFAAMSSLVSLYEPIVASCEQDFKIPRWVTVSATGGLAILIGGFYSIPSTTGVWNSITDGVFTSNLLLLSAIFEASVFAFSWKHLKEITLHNNKASFLKLGRWFQRILFISVFLSIGIFIFGFLSPIISNEAYFGDSLFNGEEGAARIKYYIFGFGIYLIPFLTMLFGFTFAHKFQNWKNGQKTEVIPTIK